MLQLMSILVALPLLRSHGSRVVAEASHSCASHISESECGWEERLMWRLLRRCAGGYLVLVQVDKASGEVWAAVARWMRR